MKNLIFCLLYVVLTFASSVLAAPSAAGAVQYLQHFGYAPVTDPRFGNIMSEEQLINAVKLFQRFAGLEQTGTFDRNTLLKMEEPRCGNPDVVGTEAAARKKRYALQGSKWEKNHLTYKMESHTSDISRREAEQAIAEGFKVWEEESGLTFSAVRSHSADIKIEFARARHGDGDPFDGPGKTLAHAFFPQFGGDAHFDEDETWVTENRRGVNLMIVAAHEFGHSLGLSHSDVNEALMAPFYNPNFNGLHRDDIRAIQTLYGAPEHRQRVTTPKTRPTLKPSHTRKTTTKSPPEGACNGRFDAITRLDNGTTYAFKADRFWRLNDLGMEKGYPKKVSTEWGFSGNVDASLTYQDQYTDFFQGSYVRRFVNGFQLPNYPKHISEVYPGIPSNVDTAYVWSGNGRIYFVKGSEYWRFNPATQTADAGYPRPLAVWKGLPSSLDAALQWKDRTYFFKNGYYWRFDDKRVQVAESLKAPYPRRSDEWWLGCSDNTLRSSAEEAVKGRHKEDQEDGDGNGSGSMLRAGASVQVMTTILLVIFTNSLS